METTPQAIIKEVSSKLHRDVLKLHGFKKTAYVWTREGDWLKIIDLQLSRWNSSEEARLTLNLGVFIPNLYRAMRSHPVPDKPKEFHCDVRTRIGMLLPRGTDRWWTVTAASKAQDLFDELSADLLDTGIPWLDGLHCYESVAAELLLQKNPFKAAVVLKLDGRDDEAAKLMRTAREKAHKLALPELVRVAKALGIPV
jgi:hypothetical protein